MDVAQTVEAAIPALMAIAGPVVTGAEGAATQAGASLGRALIERLFRVRSGEAGQAPAEPLSPEYQDRVREAVRQAVQEDPALLEKLRSVVPGGNVLNVEQGVAIVHNEGPVTLNFGQGS
ncbi:hypothetical protein ASC99_02555 [Kitasatospora sp. Root107]|nr:hypothetical protein ASC99_02555 [Kitasatospora sp. Root107]